MATQPLMDQPLVSPSNAALQAAEEACRRFDLLEGGDRVAGGMSVGKDSLLLAAICVALSRRQDLFGEVEFVPVCDTYPASQRRNIEAMVRDFETYHPEFRESVRGALYG